jgi:hypothetical protein
VTSNLTNKKAFSSLHNAVLEVYHNAEVKRFSTSNSKGCVIHVANKATKTLIVLNVPRKLSRLISPHRNLTALFLVPIA